MVYFIKFLLEWYRMHLKHDDSHLHYVAVTAIIHKDGRYLITKRSPHEKAFPNMWTVPGGRIDAKDYIDTHKNTPSAWYGEVENTLRREVREEVNLEIENIKYLVDMALLRPDGIPVIVLSYYADYKSGEVKLDDDATEFAWVTVREAEKYELIEGIYEEIVMADKLRTGADPSSVKFLPRSY